MTHAIQIREFGGPEVLVYDTVDVGPQGEVLVAQRAVGLNYIDVYQRKGAYTNPLPFTPGSEASGDVLAVGPGVAGFKVGDRVAYGTALGAYAEQRLVPAKALVLLPDAIDYETGAAMMLKGMTAQYLVRRTYRVAPGDIMLVHAAAGGVGQILCQWGKALGATVIGTAGSEAKLDVARRQGADHTINYRTDDFSARVKEITKGALCHVVYDGVGQATFEGSLNCLRPFGTFVSFGSASGAIDAFNIGLLAQKGSLYATRPTLFTHSATREGLVAMAEDVMQAVIGGTIHFDIQARFALKDAADAHRALEARDTTGSTVLLP